MIWLTWRQHRLAALTVAVTLGMLAAFILVTGLPMRDAFAADGVAACIGKTSQSCSDVVAQFLYQYGKVGENLIPWLNFAPALLGLFVGAPLIARELEHGTYRLVWTQTTSRRRWLLFKLGSMAALTVVAAVAFSALLTWWRWPLDQMEGHFIPRVFDFEGPVVIGYFLFAFALGTAAGVIVRRTFVAMVVTVGGFLALRLPIEGYFRPNYMPPLTSRVDLAASKIDTLENGSGIWPLDGGLMDRAGHVLHSVTQAQVQSGDVLRWIVYQPADRLATFQAIETAIFVGLALVLMGIAAAWARWKIA